MDDLAARVARDEYKIDPRRVAEAMLLRAGYDLTMLLEPTRRQITARQVPEDESGTGLGTA